MQQLGVQHLILPSNKIFRICNNSNLVCIVFCIELSESVLAVNAKSSLIYPFDPVWGLAIRGTNKIQFPAYTLTCKNKEVTFESI